MKRLFALLVMALVVSACGTKTPVFVNLDYAKTSYGYLNNGGYTSGSLILWDRAKMTVTTLESVACVRRDDLTPNPVDIETGYDFALDTSAQLTAAEIAMVKGAISTRTSLVAADVRRLQCRQLITSLTNHINSDPSVLSEWLFEDAVSNPDLFYLFVTDVTMGDSVEMKVDNNVSATAGFPVKLAKSTVDVKIDSSALRKINGNDVVLMFNVRVLRAIYITNADGGKNASFKPVSSVDLATLQQALRKGG